MRNQNMAWIFIGVKCVERGWLRMNCIIRNCAECGKEIDEDHCYFDLTDYVCIDCLDLEEGFRKWQMRQSPRKEHGLSPVIFIYIFICISVIIIAILIDLGVM
jgi:hypothetical protein